MEKAVKRILDTDKDLDAGLLKDIESFCKISTANVQLVYRLIYKNLNRKHAQVRYNCLLLLQKFLCKSKELRNLFLMNSCEILDVCLQVVDPLEWAKKLQRKIVELINQLYDQYSNVLPQCITLYNILQKRLETHTFLDQMIHTSRRDSRQTKSNEIRLEKYLNLFEFDIPTEVPKLREYTTQLDSLLELLVPETVIETKNQAGGIFKHGLGSQAYRLEITLKKPSIKETKETQILFESLRENRKQLLVCQLKLKEWLDLTTKVDDPDTQRHEKNIKTLIDLKTKLMDCLCKSNEILENAVVEEDSDEEFVDVDEVQADEQQGSSEQIESVDSRPPKRNTEAFIVTKSAGGLKPVFESCSAASISHEEETKAQINPRLKELYEKAPIVPFDQDLEFWSNKDIFFGQLSQHSGLEYHHRFLGDSNDKPISEMALEGLKKRMVYVKNEDPVVEYPPCNAPLRNGSLCQRRDMYKCPFHGPKIPQDEKGNPINPQENVTLPLKKQTWQVIQNDILLDESVSGQKKRRTNLEKVVKKVSVQKRLQKRSERLSRRAPTDMTLDYKERGRNAFRW